LLLFIHYGNAMPAMELQKRNAMCYIQKLLAAKVGAA
jgi:hypothetical protein